MAIETMIPEDYDPEADFDGPESGRCHVRIYQVSEEGGNRGEMIVDYEVLAHSKPGQEGRIHRDYYSKSSKAWKRIHQLALAIGMVTKAQLKDMKERGEAPTYDFENDAVGRQLCVELTDNEYQGKSRVRCGFDLYAVTDPKVAKWPKNAGMLKAAGIVLSEAPVDVKSEAGSGDVAGILDGVV